MARARGSLLAAAERRLNRRRVPECMTTDEIKKDLRSLEHKIVLAQDEIKKKQDRITLLKAEQAQRNIDMSVPAYNTMDIDPPTPAHTRVRRSDTLVGPMPQDKYFNDISFHYQQLLDRLRLITQRLVPCAFWAVLTFTDVEKLAKLILELEITAFLPDFCMHKIPPGDKAESLLNTSLLQESPEPIPGRLRQGQHRRKTLQKLLAEQSRAATEGRRTPGRKPVEQPNHGAYFWMVDISDKGPWDLATLTILRSTHDNLYALLGIIQARHKMQDSEWNALLKPAEFGLWI
ncbi:hypothetical protein BDV41DRAFT_573535 [Aspergillus transmontanensis]|uniref:Uncharacterized protein n=1 Tax=Aspergillus transmontanensis TaxID=1034304 RepID=A0A5N6WB55_9EURO|nr:hypothetical protein BDV41DRAFT_573535 [Aspergillus transmontanensis]